MLQVKEVHDIAENAVPFFANNWQGLVKVITFIVFPIVITLGGFLWKIMQGPLQKSDADLEKKLDDTIAATSRDMVGMSKRIDAVNTLCTESSTTLSELRRRVDNHDTRMDVMSQSFGELKHAVDAYEESTVKAKSDIIEMFQKKTDEQVKAAHDLALKFERLDERVKWATRSLSSNGLGKDGE